MKVPSSSQYLRMRSSISGNLGEAGTPCGVPVAFAASSGAALETLG